MFPIAESDESKLDTSEDQNMSVDPNTTLETEANESNVNNEDHTVEPSQPNEEPTQTEDKPEENSEHSL